jgi:uncharacterized protein (TIGR02996 family)
VISAIIGPILVVAIYGLLTARAHQQRRERPYRLPVGEIHVAPTFQPPPVPFRPPAVAPIMIEPPAPPEPVWHVVLSTDPAEQQLLEALRARPDDADTRLVYGDWLETRGDTARAQFVRGATLTTAEHDALVPVAPVWKAIASCSQIACARQTCPRRWSALAASPNDEARRTCHACLRVVHHCATFHELRDARDRGEMIVDDIITPSPPRQRLDFDVSD